MIWFVLFLLSKGRGSSSSSSPSSPSSRAVPVLTNAGGRLWLVRQVGDDDDGRIFDVATDSDRPVLTFADKGGVRVLRERALDATAADFGAALLGFKLRTEEPST